MDEREHYAVVVIGTGFGGTMTALSLARELKKRNEQEPDEAKKKKILMLERGTWWTTPVGTVQDPQVQTYDFLAKDHDQPVQYWPSKNSFKGFIDIATRCFRQEGKNKGGLYDLTLLGWKLPLSLFRRGDGVSILRASGVGGGSLVYSNITIRPPDLIFNDPRWTIKWDDQQRGDYYNMARDAIGNGVLFALNERDAKRITPVKPAVESVSGEVDSYDPGKTITLKQPDPNNPQGQKVTYPLDPQVQLPKNKPPDDLRLKRRVWLFLSSDSGQQRVTRIEMQRPLRTNAGLSNIVTRSARLDPHWNIKNDPLNPRGVRQIVPTMKKTPDPPAPDPKVDPDPKNELWIDRARVFQEAVSELTEDFGTVDSAINDLPPEPNGFDPQGKPYNYCERQGRCNVGCLPGARHTLNKQLMQAAYGTFAGAPPLFDNLAIKALAEVDFIKELDGGGYEIHYDHYEHRDGGQPGRKTRRTMTADKVIVAAGTMGTNEIMLRSKEKGGLPGLSDAVGLGFSTNGDYIAFMENPKELARLTRGPVTTSFAHFNVDDSGEDLDPVKPKFHTLEDQGIPPAFASLVGFGLPVIRSLSKGRNKHLFVLWAIFWWVLKRGLPSIRAFFANLFAKYRKRPEIFKSEDELSANMMCTVAMGREAAVGRFRLGGFGQTSLRVERTDGKRFHQDPVYDWEKVYAPDEDSTEGESKPEALNIKKSLGDLARQLSPPNQKGEFVNPFLTPVAGNLKVDSITVSHPLGGCRMAEDVEHGVVDEYGRIFDKRKEGQEQKVYEGLYIADGSIIPTSLGVNPSLTISALSLRVADNISKEL